MRLGICMAFVKGGSARGVDEQDAGVGGLIRSSYGADVFEKIHNGWEVWGGGLTFFDHVAECEFEGLEVVALVDGDEEAAEGDFDEFQERNAFECGIRSDNEKAGLLIDAYDFDGCALDVLGEGGLGEFDDCLGAVGVDAFELLDGALWQGQGDGAAGFVEFGRAPAQISMRHCV